MDNSLNKPKFLFLVGLVNVREHSSMFDKITLNNIAK